MIDSRWLYYLLLAAIGLAVAFLGMIYSAVFVGVPSQDLLLPLVDEAAEGSGRTKRRTEVGEPGDFGLVNHLPRLGYRGR